MKALTPTEKLALEVALVIAHAPTTYEAMETLDPLANYKNKTAEGLFYHPAANHEDFITKIQETIEQQAAFLQKGLAYGYEQVRNVKISYADIPSTATDYLAGLKPEIHGPATNTLLAFKLANLSAECYERCLHLATKDLTNLASPQGLAVMWGLGQTTQFAGTRLLGKCYLGTYQSLAQAQPLFAHCRVHMRQLENAREFTKTIGTRHPFLEGLLNSLT